MKEKDKKRAEYFLKMIGEEYSDAKCSLNYKDEFELLVATILSAQCTDERVNQVTKNLFKKYTKIEDYARANILEFEQDIYSTGFYKNKAKNIIKSSQKLLDEHKGKVPRKMDKLLELPGVARKTANVVLGNGYGITSGVVVDTHIKRLSRRFKWTEERSPEKIERDLMELIPKKDWIKITHQLIAHGRKVCISRKPRCMECFLSKECPSSEMFTAIDKNNLTGNKRMKN